MTGSSQRIRGALTLSLLSTLLILFIWKPVSKGAANNPSEIKLSQSPLTTQSAQGTFTNQNSLQQPIIHTKGSLVQSHAAGFVVARILSNANSMEERREELYQLTQTHSNEATQSLIEIASSAVEPNDDSSCFDVSLRITALEALDQRLVSGEADISAIQTVLKKQTYPTLLFFARISLEGVTSGSPGKLTRFIDKSFSVVGEG